ncbi:hypothetical protein KC678_03250 [Candidatus Dojkabacteria bacterium]|uniref:Uncharacterized protein n=1 Tax=Candidatus Dojkabacteria bacterium TaxID=2099670 RepID=A0A955L1Q7_9BACT|nr:hypothetical protein [Candidatus Dojkabacteria bacterium]
METEQIKDDATLITEKIVDVDSVTIPQIIQIIGELGIKDSVLNRGLNTIRRFGLVIDDSGDRYNPPVKEIFKYMAKLDITSRVIQDPNTHRQLRGFGKKSAEAVLPLCRALGCNTTFLENMINGPQES